MSTIPSSTDRALVFLLKQVEQVMRVISKSSLCIIWLIVLTVLMQSFFALFTEIYSSWKFTLTLYSRVAGRFKISIPVFCVTASIAVQTSSQEDPISVNQTLYA